MVPEHLASPNSNGSGKEVLGVWHPSSGAAGAQGFRPGSKEVPATAPHTHPRGLGGREGSGASRAPSDGEMWPFTFTLQCQPLNHCLSARAQGCSRRRPPTKPPPPPRTRAQSPAQPRRPGRDGSRPRLLRPLCLPLSCCHCLSLSLNFYPKDLSPGPGSHRVPAQTHQEPQVHFSMADGGNKENRRGVHYVALTLHLGPSAPLCEGMD